MLDRFFYLFLFLFVPSECLLGGRSRPGHIWLGLKTVNYIGLMPSRVDFGTRDKIERKYCEMGFYNVLLRVICGRTAYLYLSCSI